MTAPCRVEKGARIVLAVEDDEDHLLAYGIAFGREPDLRLITATNTRAAGIALRAHSVDAVLLDLSIPEDGGIALCRRIKSQPRFHYLPVIALSALPAEIYAASALAAGCCAFLQKPCSLSNIVAEVRRRLEHEIAVGNPDRPTAGDSEFSRRDGRCG
ncbi:MAG: response regulator [Candidatus Methylomirabilia bacterium]